VKRHLQPRQVLLGRLEEVAQQTPEVDFSQNLSYIE
jgi:hypothetical protein